MNKSKSLVLSILLAALLVVAGRASVAATKTAPVQGNMAQVLQPNQVSNAGINQLPPMAPGVVLVGLKPGVTVSTGRLGVQAADASLNAAFASVGVQGIERIFPNAKRPLTVASTGGEVDLSCIYRLRLVPGADVLHAVQDLNANPAVVYAEPDYLAHIIATPNDPLYPGQWGLTQINAPTAWDVVTGATDVVIAVVDAGLDTSHPDLAGQLWTNPGEIAGNSVDDDNNGYVDDIHGWNIVDDNANLSDNTGHGTQVAGVIAAATNNGAGIAGVCWNCRLMVVKVTQSGGAANYSDIAAGVNYAAQKGAEVINLSLGGYSDSATLRAAVEAASETAVVVGGAGNDDKSDPFYPAAYDDYVLAVAGTSSSDTKVGTSNYGTWVDVSAPGEVITTTFDGGGYGSTSGTSMAVPFAAGLAGLLRSRHPGWSPNTVRAQIVQTADDIDSLNPGYVGQLGSGRINAGQAVATTAQPLLAYQSHTVDGETGGRPEPGSTVDLDVTLTNEWADATNVQATLSTSDPYVTMVNATASYGSVGAYASGTNGTSFRFSVSGSAPYAHDISFTLNVTADGGYAVNIPLTIPTSPGITYVHGTLTMQTWTNDRTYIVDNDAGVGAGETLTIQPGTVVRFAGHYSLSVAGTLIADGTEEQPIRFTSNQSSPAAGDWGQIKFLDSSVDATFDGAGNYTGGSILRYAIIEYGQGVNLENAAPYIARSTFDQIGGSGISGNGSPGLVVAHNEISHIDDASCGMQLSGGDLAIVGNTVYGGMEGLSISGSGIIAENSVSNVLHWGIIAQGSLTVTANRVMDCDEGIVVDGGFVRGNLLANNDTYGLRINGGTPTVVSNTVAFNGSTGIYIQSGTPVLHHNNLVAGVGPYALRNATSSPITATTNWWGTSNDAAIQVAIYDGNDEFGLGVVNYGGYLAGPEQHAPAYLTDVTLTPASPVGIETVTFGLIFSGPMDQSTDPSAAFYPAQRGTWTQYNTSNSDLPNNGVYAIAIDDNGAKWFGTGYGGVARFDGATWTIYDASNSGLPSNNVNSIAIDGNGVKWFNTNGGMARFDGATWTIYNTSNSGLTSEFVHSIAIDSDGAKWLGTIGGGVNVLWGGQDYHISDNAQWLDATHWRATYDMTSLVPRGAHTVSVSGARGATTMMSGTLALPLPGGGMEIPTDTRFSFTVDYAGEITDQTPPPPPGVIAGGVEGDAPTVEAMWWASDPDSSITGYRYAIGSAAGATDIVNWTTTSSNSVSKSGLGLIDGQQYWLAVQARNEGGLWSASGYSAFIAGQPFPRVFLPLVFKDG